MKLLKTFNVLGLLLLSLSTAYSGEGRNGPDQSGEAIPLTLDKEITQDKIMDITKVCYEKTLNDVLTNVVDTDERYSGKQLCETSVKNAVVFPQHKTRLNITCDMKKSLYLHIDGEELDSSTSIGIYNNYFHFNIKFDHPLLNIMLTEPANSKSMPTFTYETEVVESSVDVFGRVIEGKKVVRDLKLVGRDIEPFYLINPHTGHKSGIEIDLREVASCLENGIADL